MWWLTWFLAQNNTCIKICNTVYMYCCEHYCKMMSFVTKFFMHKICKSTWKGFYSPITKEIQKIVILHLQCCTFSIERAWKKNQLFNGATETGPVTLVLHRFSSFNEKTIFLLHEITARYINFEISAASKVEVFCKEAKSIFLRNHSLFLSH